jgi:hypothetical protein
MVEAYSSKYPHRTTPGPPRLPRADVTVAPVPTRLSGRSARDHSRTPPNTASPAGLTPPLRLRACVPIPVSPCPPQLGQGWSATRRTTPRPFQQRGSPQRSSASDPVCALQPPSGSFPDDDTRLPIQKGHAT